MANLKDMTIGLSFDKKSQQRLRAIAKHASALADELEQIDNAIECPHCGSTDTTVIFKDDKPYHIKCNVCADGQ